MALVGRGEQRQRVSVFERLGWNSEEPKKKRKRRKRGRRNRRRRNRRSFQDIPPDQIKITISQEPEKNIKVDPMDELCELFAKLKLE